MSKKTARVIAIVLAVAMAAMPIMSFVISFF